LKDKDYNNLIHLKNVGGGFIPANEKAEELMLLSRKGDIIELIECTKRDISFHRAYMSLLSFIYDYLPKQFHDRVPKASFYNWLKAAQNLVDYEFEFKDGRKYVEYKSISFGKMSQLEFKEYVANQLPFIYENIIGAFFSDEMYDSIRSTIEEEYERFMFRLL
jgi:hypothetical protein